MEPCADLSPLRINKKVGNHLLDWLVRSVYTGSRLTDKFQRQLRPSAQKVVSEFMDELHISVAIASGIERPQRKCKDTISLKYILWNVIYNPEEVVIRDHKTYCTVELGHGARSRKRICLLRFNRPAHKRISLFDSGDEEQLEISSVDEINKYADRIRARARQV